MSSSNNCVTHAAVLGSGTMGAQICLSLAAGGIHVSLWGRSSQSRAAARQQIESDSNFLVESGLATASEQAVLLERISDTNSLAEAVGRASFAIEAIVEEIEAKQALLCQVEEQVAADVVLASTTSAISASVLQAPLACPQRFAIAHFAQPAHLMPLVEVVPGDQTDPSATQLVMELLERLGKRPVVCPDIPGFLLARIQHAILREFVSLVGRGLVAPEVCDTVLKEGYAVRLPAMGCFEHADLAGLDLIDSEPAREVWADLSNCDSPAKTLIAELKAAGKLGMRSGSGFYDWSRRDPVAFRRDRDEQIVQRLLSGRGGNAAARPE